MDGVQSVTPWMATHGPAVAAAAAAAAAVGVDVVVVAGRHNYTLAKIFLGAKGGHHWNQPLPHKLWRFTHTSTL